MTPTATSKQTAVETDPLDHLEERIQKAVALVGRLRQEKDSLDKECDSLRVSLEEARNSNSRLSTDLEAMKTERQQVRARLEKLLGHIDQLGPA